ncbi:MAG TPA: hypothetical protein VFJ57_15875 [Solirubrobacterales bacterium]|nr:hypothetical protein [Solirubrobacterales bacterium]
MTPTYLYWSGSLGVGRVNLEGPAAPAAILPSPAEICGLAVDPAHVYFATPAAGSIARANPDGSGVTTDVVTGLDRPCSLAVDGGHLYWLDWRGVGRANLDGTNPERSWIATAPGGCGVAVDSTYVYWSSTVANLGAIGRARLDGSERNPAFISGLPGHVGSLAVDAGHVYWTEWHEGMVSSTIGRANLDGSGATGSLITTNSFNLGGIAVDARPTPLPLPLPSRAIHLGQLRHNLHTGVATLDVSVPARGDLSVVSPRLGWKVLKGNPPPYLAGSFRWRLKVWPGKSGKVANRLRTQLRNKGRAAVTLTISYNEEHQLPLTVSKRVSLWKTLPHTRHP